MYKSVANVNKLGWILRCESYPVSNGSMKVKTHDKVYQRARGKVPFYFANVCILTDIKVQISLYQFNVRVDLSKTT